MRLPYLTSGHALTVTTSERRTRRFVRTTLLSRILASGHVSSASTMQTVSRRFLPFRSTVSPRKRLRRSIVAVCIATTELSSFVASSTMRRFGRSFWRRMAVAVSSSLTALDGSFAMLTRE
eukprot:Amastigsp_a1520_219.p6 type:complete len:121 gc:universal Amastigsp_a1520_219:382-20(-)